MIRQFRTISALMRHTWLIEPVYAEQHLPLINAFLSGQYRTDGPAQTNADAIDAQPEAAIGYILSGYAPHRAVSTAADEGSDSAHLVRHELNSEETLPENSVLVLDIRGAIFKESTCCAYGTEAYTQMIRLANANEKVIGIVCLVDSPGGQLSGTPTLYDAIRLSEKPVVSVVNEGLMASAAYWLACGSREIYATQKTDMIGSIGVFVSFRDSSEAMAKMGIKTHTIYSSRSTEKNKPFRDVLAGDNALLEADLDMAADLFREAVEQGRGTRLKAATKAGPDVFKGGLFYASKAIELGLIDGFGDLNTAVARVFELASQPPFAVLEEEETHDEEPPLEEADELEDTLEDEPSGQTAPKKKMTQATGLASDTPNPAIQTPKNPTDMLFGDKHKALSALAGLEASAITDDQLNAVNANLDLMGIAGARIISTAYLTEAETAVTSLSTANTTIQTLTKERDDAVNKATKYGSQPGHVGSKSEKLDESIAPDDTQANALFSETDAQAASLRKQIKEQAGE